MKACFAFAKMKRNRLLSLCKSEYASCAFVEISNSEIRDLGKKMQEVVYFVCSCVARWLWAAVVRWRESYWLKKKGKKDYGKGEKRGLCPCFRSSAF